MKRPAKRRNLPGKTPPGRRGESPGLLPAIDPPRSSCWSPSWRWPPSSIARCPTAGATKGPRRRHRSTRLAAARGSPNFPPRRSTRFGRGGPIPSAWLSPPESSSAATVRAATRRHSSLSISRKRLAVGHRRRRGPSTRRGWSARCASLRFSLSASSLSRRSRRVTQLPGSHQQDRCSPATTVAVRTDSAGDAARGVVVTRRVPKIGQYRLIGDPLIASRQAASRPSCETERLQQ